MTDIAATEIRTNSLLVSKESLYNTRLSQDDVTNLELISKLFKKQGEVHGTLYVVGGTITKSPPRPDIDLVLVLEEDPNSLKDPAFESYLAYSKADYQEFEEIIKKTLQGSGLNIADTTEPEMDEEYNSPAILKSDGKVGINPDKGARIEIIRCPQRGSDVFEKTARRPFVKLANF